jgi:hypothetical protein
MTLLSTNGASDAVMDFSDHLWPYEVLRVCESGEASAPAPSLVATWKAR